MQISSTYVTYIAPSLTDDTNVWRSSKGQLNDLQAADTDSTDNTTSEMSEGTYSCNSSSSSSSSGDSDGEDEADRDRRLPALSENLADLTSDISIKEKLICELELSRRRIETIKSQYEGKVSLDGVRVRWRYEGVCGVWGCLWGVRVNVCVYVCMHMCVHECMNELIHACVYIYIYIF